MSNPLSARVAGAVTLAHPASRAATGASGGTIRSPSGTVRAEVARPVPAAGAVASAAPFWLTRNRWPLFAWLHQPSAPARGAVVLCPPLLGEHLAAFDLHRSMADTLADRGILAVRFDYEGTGDSGGPTGGAGRLETWLDGVDQAVCLARAACRAPLVLLGVRSGALIAAVAAERRHDVDGLVLWDPWPTGRSFLRRQRALHSLRADGVQASGQVEVPGFVVDTSTAEAIEALRLPPTLHVGRAAVVCRPGAPAPPAVVTAGKLGSPASQGLVETIESAPGEQEACFDVEALQRRLPSATIAFVTGWLDDAVGSMERERPRLAAVGPDGSATGPPVRHLSGGEQVAVPPATAGATSVYERVVALGPHQLFGVETTGQTSLPAGAPTAVFVSSGTDSHIGPSRIWVDLARRFARSGVRCLRVDLSGLGDSAARTGRPAHVIRAPEAFDDVAEIVDAAGGPERTVLVGLCSGAYQALESALELRPMAVLGINPVLRFTPPELADGGEQDPRRRLCELRQPWVPSVRDRMPRSVRRMLVWSRRAWRRHRARRVQGSWLDELVGSGVRTYLVCGGEEVRAIPAIRTANAGSPGSGSDLLRVEVVDTLDHALTVADHREDVMERFAQYMQLLVAGANREAPA